MVNTDPVGGRTYVIGEYQYLITHFEAQFTGAANASSVAAQFTEFVVHYANHGFEFYRVDEVPYRINSGCLAGLFGASDTGGKCTIVSFRKKNNAGLA